MDVTHPADLDVAANRKAQKYSSSEMARRVAWGAGQWLIRLSPRPCFAWRRGVLRLFGARVGAQVHLYPSTRIYFPWNLSVGDWSALGEEALIYNVGRVTIGDKVTVSHRAHICAATHDYTRPDLPLLKRSVVIGDGAWVCTEAFIGPGVTVGEGAVVGARAVVVKHVPPWMVVAGNPARVLKQRVLNVAR